MSFNIQAAIDAYEAERDAEIASLKSQIVDLEHQVELLLAAADKAKAELTAAQMTIARLQARIAELEAGNPAPEPEPEPEEPEQPQEPEQPTTPGAFPDASNTGAKTDGVTFTTISGTHRPKANTVYENLKISDAYLNNVKNVTYKNCIFTCSSWYAINGTGDYSGLKLIDCTFNGQAKKGGSYAVNAPSDCIITGCDFYGWENAINTGSRMVIKGNYIHDLLTPDKDSHYDGIAVQGGQDDVLIEGNTIIAWNTSGVFIATDFGNVNNIRVVRNLIKNQSPTKKYAAAVYVYGKGNFANGKATNCQLIDNICEVGGWGYWFAISGNTQGLEVRGNTDLKTGKPIS